MRVIVIILRLTSSSYVNNFSEFLLGKNEKHNAGMLFSVVGVILIWIMYSIQYAPFIWMLLVEQEPLMRSEPIGFLPLFSAVHDVQYWVLCVVFCRSLLVCLSFWSLDCLTAIDLWLLIAPVQSSTFCFNCDIAQLFLIRKCNVRLNNM